VNPQLLIENTKQELAEWLDMADDPYRVVSNCLAMKLCQQQEYVVYLERRLKDRDASVAFNKHRAHSWDD
jgi:hypothetical protein